MDLKETKIDLAGKTLAEKKEIFDYIKQYATGIPKGHYSIKCVEKTESLIGLNAFRGHTCYAITADNGIWIHLQDFAFIMLSYKAITVKTKSYLSYVHGRINVRSYWDVEDNRAKDGIKFATMKLLEEEASQAWYLSLRHICKSIMFNCKF